MKFCVYETTSRSQLSLYRHELVCHLTRGDVDVDLCVNSPPDGDVNQTFTDVSSIKEDFCRPSCMSSGCFKVRMKDKLPTSHGENINTDKPWQIVHFQGKMHLVSKIFLISPKNQRYYANHPLHHEMNQIQTLYHHLRGFILRPRMHPEPH